MSSSVSSEPLDWHLSGVHELTYYLKVLEDISAGGRTRNVKYNHHTSLKEIPLFYCKIQLIALLTLYFAVRWTCECQNIHSNWRMDSLVGLEYTKSKILPNLLYAHHVLSNFVTSRFQPRFLLDFGHLTSHHIYTGHAAMRASAHWLAPQTWIHLSYLQGEGKHPHTSGYVVSIYLSSLFLTGNNCVNLVLMH